LTRYESAAQGIVSDLD